MKTDYKETGIVTAPVVLTSVAALLGKNCKDVGTLCVSDKINMWAKYKPVVSTQKAMPTEEINSTKDGWDLPASGDPWWYGLQPSYPANKITHLDNKLEDVKSKVTWEYIRPYNWFRLGDFVGYDHEAECPFSAGVPNLDEIYINTKSGTSNFGITIRERESGRNDLSLAEIAAMNGKASTFKLYVCAFMKIRRAGKVITTVGAASKTAIQDTDDGVFFSLNWTPNSANNTASLTLTCEDGISSTAQQVEYDDYLELYLCMTDNDLSTITSGTEITPETLNMYSALPDENGGSVYRLIHVSFKDVTYYITYAFSGTPSVDIDTSILVGKYYVDDEGSIYKISGRITGIYATVAFDANTKCCDYSSFVVRTSASARCTTASGETGTVKKCGNIGAYSESAGNFKTDKTITMNGSGGSTFTYYDSEEDAMNEENGHTGSGIPVFNEIVYNNSDAEIVGTIGSGDLKINPYAKATTAWTSIEFTGNGTITTLN